MIKTVHILIVLLVWEISFARLHQHSSLRTSEDRKLNVHDVVEKSYFDNLMTNLKEMFDFEANSAKEFKSVRDLKDEKRHFISQGKPRTQPIRVKKARHDCIKSSSPSRIPGLLKVTCHDRVLFGSACVNNIEFFGECRTLKCRAGNDEYIPYDCECAKSNESVIPSCSAISG